MQEENKDKLHIRLRVCDTEIPIRVYREEEEVYRRAAALVTSIVNLYTSRAQGKKGTIEILYMALIDIARTALKQNNNRPMSAKEIQIDQNSTLLLRMN